MQVTAPKINPAFRALIPPLAPEELAQLEANLAADGCRDPLVTWNGTLLDGHNRLEICRRKSIAFKTVQVDLPDENAAKAWIIRNQFGRRNITLFSRCRLADELAKILEPLAQENLSAGGGDRKSNKGKSGSPILAKAIDVREEAAKEAGVSHGSLSAFRFLQENATPQEIAELETDPNAKLHKVVKAVKERKAKSGRKKKRIEAAAKSKLDSRIVVGDFRECRDKVADGSVALIFTDPPYDRKAESLFPGLAEFAAAKLAEGGSLIMYAGHLQLPALFAAFDGKLRHWWTCACVHSGKEALMREYGVRAGWKPMLWFVMGTRDDKSNIVSDVVSGGMEKDAHDWQQAQSEAEYWIEELCPKDGLVCDPFLGGGTTAAAANALKRSWVGFEIDPETARIASTRLGEA